MALQQAEHGHVGSQLKPGVDVSVGQRTLIYMELEDTMGLPDVVKQLKGLFGNNSEGEVKKQVKLERKYGLKSGGTAR